MILLQRFIATEHCEDTKTSPKVLQSKCHTYIKVCFVGKRSTCKVAIVVRSTSWREKKYTFYLNKRGRRNMWIRWKRVTIVRNLTGQLRVLNTEIYKGQRSTSQPMADVSADISLHHICHEIRRFPNTCYVRGLLWRRSGSRAARFTNIE